MKFLSDEQVEDLIDDSHVKEQVNKWWIQKMWYVFMGRESNMDYGVTNAIRGILNKDTLYIRNGVAYNLGDIGNYLWGRAMAEIGIGLNLSRIGAYGNNLLFGWWGQKTSYYDFGSMASMEDLFPAFIDSPEDQKAIIAGYDSKRKRFILR